MHQHSCYRDPRRRREKEPEKIFEGAIATNFSNLEKEMVTQVQEVQRVSIQDKHKEEHSRRHINQIDKKLQTKRKY